MGACSLILHIHVVANWQLSKQGIRWPVSHYRIAGLGIDSFCLRVFLKLSADKLLVFQMIAGSSSSFLNARGKSSEVVLMSRSINILIDSGRENSASFYRRAGNCFWLFSPWSLIGHALRPIFMLWLLKIWQVGSRGKFMHYLETCLVIAEADSFVSSYSCTKWKTAAIKILLLFMAGLFIGCLVEKCSAFPSHRKSVFWWHRFQKWAST